MSGWDNSVDTGFDFFTLMLYMMTTMVLIMCLGTINARNISSEKFVTQRKRLVLSKNKVLLILFWVLLIFLAVFRMVNDDGVGGPDVSEYVRRFIYGWSGNEDISIRGLLTLKNGEPFLYTFFAILRLFTDNYRIMFLIYYGFVAFCYIYYSFYFFSKYRNAISFVGVPLLMKEFFYSFSVMRFGLGLAFILLAMVKFSQKRKTATAIFCVCAILSHLTLVIPVGMLVLEYFIRKISVLERIQKRRRVIVLFVVVEVTLYVVMPRIMGIIMSTKFGYANNGGLSVRGQLIYLFVGILTLYFYDELKGIFKEDVWIVDLEIMEVALIPIMLNIDAYRIHNMFVGVKTVLLGAILVVMKRRIKNKGVADVCA